MSKQSEAKAEQGYREKPDTCSNCCHYESQIVEKCYGQWRGTRTWTVEKNLRCGLGGFKTKKTATCDRWAIKQ